MSANQAIVKEFIPKGTRALILRNKAEVWLDDPEKTVAENDPVMSFPVPRDLPVGEVVEHGWGIA